MNETVRKLCLTKLPVDRESVSFQEDGNTQQDKIPLDKMKFLELSEGLSMDRELYNIVLFF